jgi:hypothetical protein
MNKEQQELLDEAYKNYLFTSEWFPISGVGGGFIGTKANSVEIMTQGLFINICKTDNEFAKTWGLKIEERELSFNSRYRIGKYQPYNIEGKVEFENGLDYITESQFENFHNKEMDKLNIPTKLITITYNDKTIESYE